FFEWFRNREDLENERRLDSPPYRDIQLQAVRSAIESFLPGFSQLRVRRSPLRIVVSKEGQELIVSQLSDGEKCLLALVSDLARRLAMVNPGLPDPLQGEAVVLIDEVDLHLHPKWQRSVIDQFERTFPNCQFILTTHSPQILSHVKPESVFILTREQGRVAVVRPAETFGLDSNRVLEEVLDVPERPQEIKDKLSEIFNQLDLGRLDETARLLQELKEQIGDDPELIKAGVILRRKEIIGR
ncbi:MAG: AAA family ATPase, partial [Deltaproteobacteria bacterium]|nr:AAA family ATPase [Deltaproteobacteria bacterium]